MSSAPPSYKGHRYPVEIISHCVRLHHRLPLSFREVEELMLERGVIVSHETIRRWCAKFGQGYANGLRRRRPRPGDKRHLDEVFIKIGGERKYLWRAADADGNVLHILIQNRRDKTAARRSAFSGISPHFQPRRHLMTASGYRTEMTLRFPIWKQATGTSRPTTA